MKASPEEAFTLLDAPIDRVHCGRAAFKVLSDDSATAFVPLFRIPAQEVTSRCR